MSTATTDGTAFLGSTLGGNSAYTGTSLTAGTGNTYRIGAGGSTLNFNSTALVDNSGTKVQVGAISNALMANSIGLANGSGTASFNNVQTYTGGTTINGGGTLQIGITGAINSTGTLTFNGGNNPNLATATVLSATIQPGPALGLASLLPVQVVNNSINLIGDMTANGNGANDLILSGNITLANNQTGVNRFINVTAGSARTYLTGNITDGTGGSGNGLVKVGAGVLELTGSNSTYTGNTYILAGTVALGATAEVGPNTANLALGVSDIPTTSPYIYLQGGTLAFWDSAGTATPRQRFTGTTLSGGSLTETGRNFIDLDVHRSGPVL